MNENLWTYIFDKESGNKIESFYGRNSEKYAAEYLKEHNINSNDVIIYTEDKSND